MYNCLNDCPCSTELLPINETFAIPPCVARIGTPTIYSCPINLNEDKGCCSAEAEVEVCGQTLRCSLDLYYVRYSGNLIFTIALPVFDGENCPVPEIITLVIPYDIGSQICYYCEKSCPPELPCESFTIENLQIVLDTDNDTVTVTGQPVFECPFTAE
ncbi:hypothetical protein ACQCVE_05830 [Metabacillus sp. 113a]|uniref:hypothetical protein n=1 Tax=Metabacillus sp. 113a TaxID=3404706 RepID=UPI003CE6E448